MKRKHGALVVALLLAAILLGHALAAGQLGIDRYSVDGGGARSSGGGYTLNGSIGQPDVGSLSSARFSVSYPGLKHLGLPLALQPPAASETCGLLTKALSEQAPTAIDVSERTRP